MNVQEPPLNLQRLSVSRSMETTTSNPSSIPNCTTDPEPEIVSTGDYGIWNIETVLAWNDYAGMVHISEQDSSEPAC